MGMIVGLLPALGGGIAELRRSGQDSRLIDGYLKPYAEAFDRVLYFSYCREALREYTDDAGLLSRVDLLQHPLPWSRLGVAVSLPLVHGGAMRTCSVLRSFQVTGVIPALIARALWGIPFVTTYGFWYARLSRPGPSGPAKRLLERVALRLAAGVIVPTESLRSHVTTLTSSDRVHLIPNGVDTSRFTPSALSSSPRERERGERDRVRRILYVGRLEAEKNLATLVAAAAKLVERFPLTLTFVGAGSLQAEIQAQAEALGVPAEFPGVVDHRRLPECYREADAFVLPSFTEGHPKVLLEAMSCGVPCVASNVGGNRAILTDGQTGLLFDPLDAGALADRLERVFIEGEFARRLGERARMEISKRYDLGTLVGQEIDLLRRVAGGG